MIKIQKLTFFLLFCILFLILIPSGKSNGTKIETITVLTEASDDARVDEGQASLNFGEDDYLSISGYYVKEGGEIFASDYAYIKFPLGERPSQWDKAEISLYFITIDDPTTINIHLVNNNSWSEDTITWDNRPLEGELITSFSISEETKYTFDVSNYIQDPSLSICIKYQTPTDTNGKGNDIVSINNPWFKSEDKPHIIWSYDVEKYISVVSPDKDEAWSFGDHLIKWESSEGIDDVDIELWRGNTVIDVLTFIQTDNDGSYEWRIHRADNETYITADNYRIKIIDDDDSEVYGFSEYFSIDTTIDSTKGHFICPGEPYTEQFNGEKDSQLVFAYEFSLEQRYSIAILSQDSTLMHKETITARSGNFDFTSDRTEVLLIIISIEEGKQCAYVKMNYYNPSEIISGYPLLPLVLSLSAIGIILILRKSNFK